MKSKMRLKRGNPKVSSFLEIITICLALGCGLCGCTDPAETKSLKEFEKSITREQVHVTIPGMKGSKQLLYLSDLHLVTESDQIAPGQRDEVHNRKVFFSHEGVTAADAWLPWTKYLDSTDSDALLFGADMVDFASESNVDCLKKGLDQLKTPWTYVRADHDIEPYFLEGVSKKECLAYHDKISPWEEVMTMEFDEFMVVGWNNSTEQLSEAGLERMKELFAAGKPIILLTHVPIKPLVDDSLEQKSREAWNDRALLWGEGCDRQPNDVTREFLDMIYAEDTPVCQILCGHLHFSWDGHVTKRVKQHVFSAAYAKNLGVITVSGD
ncbi:MAG: metallophosphoesterase [Lachnospiraceae bacterium]|nr:metallophosphoesterase [Lachnospiraceae bacterium]